MRVAKGKKPTQKDRDALEIFRDELLEEFDKRKQKTVWDAERPQQKHPDATEQPQDVPF